MSIEAINTAIVQRLKTVRSLPTLIEENTGGDLPSDATQSTRTGTYTRTTLLPAETTDLTVGEEGYDEWKGLMQVDLFYPTGTGTIGANTIAQRIIEAFPQSNLPELDGVSVRIRKVWSDNAQGRTNFYMLPVMIRWTAHIKRIPQPVAPALPVTP